MNRLACYVHLARRPTRTPGAAILAQALGAGARSCSAAVVSRRVSSWQSRGIFPDRAAFGEQRLVVEQLEPVPHALGARLTLVEGGHAFDQRMLQVQLQNSRWLGISRFCARKQALDVRRQRAVACTRTAGESVRRLEARTSATFP